MALALGKEILKFCSLTLWEKLHLRIWKLEIIWLSMEYKILNDRNSEPKQAVLQEDINGISFLLHYFSLFELLICPNSYQLNKFRNSEHDIKIFFLVQLFGLSNIIPAFTLYVFRFALKLHKLHFFKYWTVVLNVSHFQNFRFFSL